uniref:AlNc14C20G2095 protein n=1 Tax=Albugo laibachii Nc14 TaxID=890382 RepID=F0W5C9_9STRA|nr:AlNc14C20G2095 [Albugo laibachii Nc14]|eukprot:CCA16320.1 AlNc14C20G2095 [Albugo laibachii Nc14]
MFDGTINILHNAAGKRIHARFITQVYAPLLLCFHARFDKHACTIDSYGYYSHALHAGICDKSLFCKLTGFDSAECAILYEWLRVHVLFGLVGENGYNRPI